ncbi:MAG: ribosomal protein S18-alanine N-acetyltransferase [Candidatus Acidiferrales bacterium]
MEGAVTIRRLESGDVESVLAIQRACPGLAQWSQQDYEAVARSEMPGWVAVREKDSDDPAEATNATIVGFLVARLVAPEIEILNLGVDPTARRRGTGRALLEAALRWGAGNGAQKAFLEVRESNQAAIQFYEVRGFQMAGRRTRYYSAPVEDALRFSVSIH